MLFQLLFLWANLILLVSVIRAKTFCDVENGYDEASAMAAVDVHNTFRTEMAKGTFKGPNGELPPKAARMRKLSWSCELQKSAQDWANECTSGYSENGLGLLGENTYSMDSPSLASRFQKANGSAKMVSEVWLKQYASKGFKELKKAEGIGRSFTMAAEESYQLGCGYKVCQDIFEVKGVKQHRLRVVCQYNPGKNGNAIGGDTAYKIGEPCSECGQAFTCEKKGGTDVPIERLPDTIGHCNVKNGYNEENTRWIVDSHNKFRSAMAKGEFEILKGTQKSEKSSNMRKIYWNCTLQASAQWWAQNGGCTDGHSKTGGENMWMYDTGAKQETWIDPQLDKRINGSGLVASEAWPWEFIGRGFYNYTYTEFTSHALPMAWAETNQIGCGYHICKKAPYANGWYWHRIVLVCQYRPNGNVVGRQGYKFGEPCSNCGKGFTCEKTGSGLCVPDK